MRYNTKRRGVIGKAKKIYQFKSIRLWKDSIAIGFAIFGGASAIMGILGVSFTDIFDNVLISLSSTMAALLYLIGVDDTFSTSEDDAIISHSSLHGKLIKQLKENEELESFKDFITGLTVMFRLAA